MIFYRSWVGAYELASKRVRLEGAGVGGVLSPMGATCRSRNKDRDVDKWVKAVMSNISHSMLLGE